MGQLAAGVLRLKPGVAAIAAPRIALVQPMPPPDPPVAPRPDLDREPPDPRLIARLEPRTCLQQGVLPWRRRGAATVVLCDDPLRAAAKRPAMEAALGPVRLHPLPEAELRRALLRQAARDLVHAAETRAPLAQSCRGLDSRRAGRRTAAVVTTLGIALALQPAPVLGALAALVLLTRVLMTLLKLACWTAALTAPPDRPVPADPVPARLPVVSLLVPLYREREIAAHLLRRLEALDYPRDRLDLCLVLEDDDATTRAALDAARLPDWAQVIEVPRGTLRTKPRALNYALDFARGTIIGIYDAEDAPAGDQIRRVVNRFAARGPEVACLQGILDYYNARATWIARCFTLEYAAWFRVMLPGLERLGLVIPLGGTTLFLRRAAIEAVSGWDAHNVTEDADLGLRLARHGYRTELIPTVTEEEANARPWPWVRQRSRWLKGYAMTWAVHMRDPARLWRDLGPWRFLGVQVLFLGTLSQFLMAPLVWSFWLILLSLPVLADPIATWPVVAAFLLTGGTNVAMSLAGAWRADKRAHALWIPLMTLYYPLATVAAYRGLAEILSRPFFWDKTAHRVTPGATPPPEPCAHPA